MSYYRAYLTPFEKFMNSSHVTKAFERSFPDLSLAQRNVKQRGALECLRDKYGFQYLADLYRVDFTDFDDRLVLALRSSVRWFLFDQGLQWDKALKKENLPFFGSDRSEYEKSIERHLKGLGASLPLPNEKLSYNFKKSVYEKGLSFKDIYVTPVSLFINKVFKLEADRLNVRELCFEKNIFFAEQLMLLNEDDFGSECGADPTKGKLLVAINLFKEAFVNLDVESVIKKRDGLVTVDENGADA